MFSFLAFTEEKVGEFVGNPRVWHKDGKAIIGENNKNWSYLFFDKHIPQNQAIETEFIILNPCRRKEPVFPDWFRYTIQRDDPGYDLCVVGRYFGSSLTESWWYRIQISYAYQEIVLHKGNGGYIKVVPIKVEIGKPIKIKMEIIDNRIIAYYNDKKVIEYEDKVAPIIGEGAKWGVGVYESKVKFNSIKISDFSKKIISKLPERKYKFSFKEWHGRKWVFCDDEPIAQFIEKVGRLGEMKLLPGYQPQLKALIVSCNNNQRPGIVEKIEPIGKTENAEKIRVKVQGYIKDPAAKIENIIEIGYDKEKGTYYYNFEFTGILDKNDPKFQNVNSITWNYLFPYNNALNAWHNYPPSEKNDFLFLNAPDLPKEIIRTDNNIYSMYTWEIFYGEDGVLYRVPVRKDWDYNVPFKFRTRLYHSPVSEFRPSCEYGKIFIRGIHPVCNPCIQFLTKDIKFKFACSTCAFSHENWFGWVFDRNDPLKNSEIKANFKFFGILPEEMNKIFKKTKLPPLPQVNLTKVFYKKGTNYFRPEQLNSVSEPCQNRVWLGAYDVDKDTGYDDKYSLILEQMGWVEFKPIRQDSGLFGYIPSEKYLLSFMIKTYNLYGKGIYVDITRGKETKRYYLDLYGTNDWQKIGVVTDMFSKKGDGKIKIMVDGTGKVWIDNVEIRPLGKDEKISNRILQRVKSDLPESKKTLKDVIFDFRMEEKEGNFIYNYGEFGNYMELSNVEWKTDSGINAIVFSDENKGKKPFTYGDIIYTNLGFARDKKDVVFGLARGNFSSLKDFTICTAIKPGKMMYPSHWLGSIFIGFGGRSVELALKGKKPPYLLGVNLGFHEFIWTEAEIEPNKWYHIVFVGETQKDKKMKFSFYLNGKLIKEKISDKITSPMKFYPFVILGAEIYYLHEGFYRGLIGPLIVYKKALSSKEIEELYKKFSKKLLN